MKTAGYSGTPLHKKLGIKTGASVRLINAPGEYTEWLGSDCPSFTSAKENEMAIDFVHIFTNSADELAAFLASLKNQIHPDGMVWVSWYKKSAKKHTEVTENLIRDIALPLGWVDIKVCAVSDDWSGLKLVITVKQRVI